MIKIIFSLLCIIVVCIELWLIKLVYNNKSSEFPAKRYIICAAISIMTILSYVISINVNSYFLMSFFSSVYFSTIDLLMINVVLLFIDITHIKLHLFQRVTLKTNVMYGVFDCIIMMINPFKEIALHYVQSGSGTHWDYSPCTLYTMHLIFCYLLVVEVFYCITVRIINVPSIYRSRYSLLAYGLIAIVVLNCFFLYAPFLSVFDYDISVILYGLMFMLIYYNGMYYFKNKLLKEAPKRILMNLKNPLVLFDYEEKFAISNVSAAFFLPDYTDHLYLDEFALKCGFSDKINKEIEATSFQWIFKDKVYQCDYKVLKQKESRIGYVFIFTEVSMEYDVLTGFYSETASKRKLERQELSMPTGILLCDLNRLAYINEKYGRDLGDKAISAVGKLMQDIFPEGSCFVRLNDALLMCICPHQTYVQMRSYERTLKESVSALQLIEEKLNLECAISICTYANPDVTKAILSAKNSIRARKMLDINSSHSSILSSLICMQKEIDPASAQHFARTRLLGEKLAKRLELSDEESANLSLLCFLHDIGKLCIPYDIVNKPEKLTKQEWEVFKTHTTKGYDIAMSSHELAPLANSILHHHECWDGSGYPGGLTKEEIPLLSRIICVIDSYDEMLTDRPYYKAISMHSAIRELESMAGKRYDPYIVSEFTAMIRQMESYRNEENLADDPENTESIWKDIDEIQSNQDSDPDDVVMPVRYSRYLLGMGETIVSADDNFEYLTGYNKEDVATMKLTQSTLIFPDDQEEYNKLRDRLCNENKEAYIEHRLRMKNGQCRYVNCLGTLIYDSQTKQTMVQITIVDLTESVAVREMLKRERSISAHNLKMWKDSIRHDPLTGALNRMAFRNDFQEVLLRNDIKCVMVMCDLDNFKNFNDTKGHMMGDELLKYFTLQLKEYTGRGAFVCRMGGDEFALGLTFDNSCSYEMINTHTRKIWESVNSELQQYDSNISTSMGMTLSDKAKKNFAQMYKEADEALYAAKENGKNQLVIYKY